MARPGHAAPIPSAAGRSAAKLPAESLDLTTLRVVVAVAEAGSISAGSDRAGLALGAVSARIAALESASGARLFERSSRGVRLTAAGQLLVLRGRELLADADRLTLDLRDFGQGERGHVRLLSNASAIIEFLPRRLTTFQRAHPLIRVEVEERSSPEIPLILIEGRADLGIVDISHPVQGLAFEPLFSDELVVIVSAQHRLAHTGKINFADVLDEDFVCLPDGNAVSGRLVAEAALLGRTLSMRIQMRSFDAVCRMVAGGVGVSVLPRQAIAPQLAALPLRAVTLNDRWARRTHRIAWCETSTPSGTAHQLLRALLRSAAA